MRCYYCEKGNITSLSDQAVVMLRADGKFVCSKHEKVV